VDNLLGFKICIIFIISAFQNNAFILLLLYLSTGCTISVEFLVSSFQMLRNKYDPVAFISASPHRNGVSC